MLKFTPLEFETVRNDDVFFNVSDALKFTPLEFETREFKNNLKLCKVKIYSVGV